MAISDAERRTKAAIDAALDQQQTEALCDIGDMVDVLEQLNQARLRLVEFGEGWCPGTPAASGTEPQKQGPRRLFQPGG